MPRAPRAKRVLDPSTGTYRVIGRPPTASPNRTSIERVTSGSHPGGSPTGVWADPPARPRRPPWSRDRHVAAAEEASRCAPLAEGFTTRSTLAELGRWWLDNVARHRVRVTTLATYEKQLRLVAGHLGEVPVRQLRPEQVTAFISDLVDTGSASRAVNVRTLLVQVLNEGVSLGLAEENIAKKVKRPRVPRAQSGHPG